MSQCADCFSSGIVIPADLLSFYEYLDNKGLQNNGTINWDFLLEQPLLYDGNHSGTNCPSGPASIRYKSMTVVLTLTLLSRERTGNDRMSGLDITEEGNRV